MSFLFAPVPTTGLSLNEKVTINIINVFVLVFTSKHQNWFFFAKKISARQHAFCLVGFHTNMRLKGRKRFTKWYIFSRRVRTIQSIFVCKLLPGGNDNDNFHTHAQRREVDCNSLWLLHKIKLWYKHCPSLKVTFCFSGEQDWTSVLQRKALLVIKRKRNTKVSTYFELSYYGRHRWKLQKSLSTDEYKFEVKIDNYMESRLADIEIIYKLYTSRLYH